MRIDKLTVTGFRCFERAEFAFQPQFNLIVGENGSGKTSLLEALSVAAGAWLLGIRGYDSRNIGEDDVRMVPIQSGQEVTFEEAELTAVKAQEGKPDTRHLLNGKRYDPIWTRSRRGKAGRTTRVYAKYMTAHSEMTAAQVRKGQDVLLPLISYYGTGRLWNFPRELRPELKSPARKNGQSRFEGYRNSVDGRCTPVEFAKWLQRQAWIEFQEKQETEVSIAVRKAVISCLDGGRRIWFSAKHGQVLVDIEGHGILPFENLSDGQRNIVAMIGDIAIKMATLNPHLGGAALTETPGIVLIDELDLHLHPRWQRRVVGDLKRTFPKIQFFCTTHSPQIIGEVPRQEIMLVTPEGGGEVPVGLGADSNWILKHVMGSQERNEEAQKLIDAVDDALDEGEMIEAEQNLASLRELVGTEDEGEVARLESSIRNLERLADEED